MKGRSLGNASVGLLVATAVSNLSMVAYHRVLSDRLGADYAQLVALLAVVNVLSNFSSGLNTYLVKAFSVDAERVGPAAVKGRLALLIKPGLLSLGIIIAVLAACSPWVATYLKLPDTRPALVVAVIFTVGVVVLTLRSAQQGLHHFGWLGLSLAGDGLSRVAVAGLAAAGVEGALVAVLFGQSVGGLCALAGFAGLGPAHEPAPGRGKAGRVSLGVLEGGVDTMALTLLALLSYLDVVVLKHYYTDERASLYSRAALVAKSFLYLPAALNMVLLAAAARDRAGGRDPRVHLRRFMLWALALDAVGLVVVWGRTSFFIGLLAGPNPVFRTDAMIILTRWFSLAVVPLGLLQMVVVYLLAIRRRGVALGLAVLASAYLMLLRFVWGHELAVVAVLGACSLLGLAVALGAALAWAPSPSGLGLVGMGTEGL